MRNVKSFEDCNVLFRELYNQLDKMNSEDLNMKKRRAVNASPSSDLYDYVVRKELLDLIPEASKRTTISQISSSGLYVVVFTNPGTIRTASYATGPYIFKRRSRSVAICVSAVTPPGTGSASFNVWHNGSAILNNDLLYPSTATSLEVVTSTDFTSSPITFEIDDTIVLNVTNGAGCQKISIELLVEEI